MQRNRRRARTAAYEKGHARIETILDAAADTLIHHGYHRLTMRQIAKRAGMTVGNLGYYYPSKEMLLKDLLDTIAHAYLEEMERIGGTSGDSPQDRFTAIVRYLIDDLNTRRTSRLFPELWALANHYRYAAKLLDDMYARERQALADLIRASNPALSEGRTHDLALFVSASIEGMTMFLGAGKKHEKAITAMKDIACRSFLRLIEMESPGEIAAD